MLYALNLPAWWSTAFLVLGIRYLLPEHLGPCTLRITFSAHTDLSVKFQSHRSRYYWFIILLVYECIALGRFGIQVQVLVSVFTSSLSLAHCWLLFASFVKFDSYPLFTLFDHIFPFCKFRDYTNPYLPVASSAIDGSGQVRFWNFILSSRWRTYTMTCWLLVIHIPGSINLFIMFLMRGFRCQI